MPTSRSGSSPRGSPIVAVRGLETRLGSTRVHRGLDLDVRHGELLATAGASGSGKTVLLRAMSLLLAPTAGEVRLFGEATRGLGRSAERALRRRLGVMFQHGALFTGLTVAENVGFVLREHTRLPPTLVARAARLKIALAGLPAEAAALYPAELSGGMTKRAALARALALDPELLFLDEPTAGLDPLGAAAFDRLILRLRELLGLTVVVVTHDADSLWEIADRIAFLGDGRVLDIGEPARLAASPIPAVRRYFEGPRMQRARERSCKPE
ncbi:ABC transporter ATP-binding protein [Spiribacter halobius]|uniref:ABC transporter ATP-binding protein n=1 Tax=Sediminicurvatus halobius TaxID=2182432 RepID=UPI001E524662|nr:ATP-binding cassette domain-containing protein [Spiribacter halobius]UEX78497.1 ATP-binding cassette domain-containing protein [Spiribacter halobius]